MVYRDGRSSRTVEHSPGAQRACPGLDCVLSTSICCLACCLHCALVLTSRVFAAVQASIAANTYVVSGASQTKSEGLFFK
jgi:hypothetical protein